MFAFFGGGNSISGVKSDNQTPGGEIIEGSIAVGNATASESTPFSALYGSVGFIETPANQQDVTDVIDVVQAQTLMKDSRVFALWVGRSGSLNGFDYINPALAVQDDSLSLASIFSVHKLGTTVLDVKGDGIAIHGKIETNSATVHVLGAYSGKAVQIYDESGTSLGFIPLYS